MNYREVTLLAKKTLGDSGTETLDLDIRDPITELNLYFEQNNPAASDLDDYPPERCITKIEIVDGGKTYLSLTGMEAVGVAAVEVGEWPHCFYNETQGQNHWIYIPIRFGRYLGDPDFAFDPTKLRNPQLKVTYELGGHLTANNEIAIFAKVMEGVPGPSQCLLWRSIRSYAAAVGAIESTPMPTDHPYRRLLMRGWGIAVSPTQSITNYKLTCDVDKLTVFDLAAKDMYALMRREFGLFTTKMMSVIGASRSLQSWVIPVFTGVCQSAQFGRMGHLFAAWGVYSTVSCYTHAGVATDTACHTKSTGIAPHSCVQYQFGDRDKPETWFRASQYGSVDTILTHNNAASAISVAVQQPVPLGR